MPLNPIIFKEIKKKKQLWSRKILNSKIIKFKLEKKISKIQGSKVINLNACVENNIKILDIFCSKLYLETYKKILFEYQRNKVMGMNNTLRSFYIFQKASG